MLNAGDTIEFVRTVMFPPRQAGEVGDVRTLGEDISVYDANYLLRGGHVKQVTEERKESNEGNDGTGDQESDR